jgi:hypothetical protein
MSYRRVVRVQKLSAEIELTAVELENMERRTIAFLYALWDAMGVKKKIIVIGTNGHYEEAEDG